jgi:hypothetical protein
VRLGKQGDTSAQVPSWLVGQLGTEPEGEEKGERGVMEWREGERRRRGMRGKEEREVG